MARKPDIRKTVIEDFTGSQLVIREYLDQGRDGIVYIGNFKKMEQYELAVKFYVPVEQDSLLVSGSRLPTFIADLENRYNNELNRLKSLSHPNLQRYWSSGKWLYDHDYFHEFKTNIEIGSEIPFIVSRYVPGDPLHKKIKKDEGILRPDFVRYLYGIAEGILYLHKNRILHGDVRPENIVISSDTNTPVLIDFGLSKGFTQRDTQFTQFFFDPNPIPKRISEILGRIEEGRGKFQREKLGEIVFPFLDLYQFGIMVERLLTDLVKKLTRFDREYLQLVVGELKKWELSDPRFISEKTTMSGEIKCAEDLVNRLKKLIEGPDYYSREFGRKEITPPRTIVRTKGSVSLRESLTPIASHPALGRLNNIHQLAMLHYVYPSTGQSRFDHVLSALGRAQDIWQALAKNPTFLFLMDVDDIERLEISALLHDINHFPFLHYFHEAGIPEVRRADVLENFLSIKGSVNGKIDATSLKDILQKRRIGVDYLRTLNSDASPGEWAPQDQIIKSIINSGVDVDKLAYLPDDAAFTGAPFGQGVDIFGILDDIEVAEVPMEPGRVWHIVFSQESLPAIESICFARYWNFQRIYWHRTNRGIASMIIWTIRELYSRPEHSLKSYLFATQNLGESGALEYLADLYYKTLKEKAPIEGLAANREMVYRSIFEMSFEGEEELLQSFQSEEFGIMKRIEAQGRIIKEIIDICNSIGCKDEIQKNEVLLDIPLRKMNLGGPIYIRGYDGIIEPAVKKSSVLRELQASFEAMSKVLRVFIAPRIRNEISSKIEDPERELRKRIYKAVCGKKPESEVK